MYPHASVSARDDVRFPGADGFVVVVVVRCPIRVLAAKGRSSERVTSALDQ